MKREAAKPPPYGRPGPRVQRRPPLRAVLWQAAALLAILVLGAWIWNNLTGNLARRELDIDFGFLRNRASFEFGENLAGYRPGESFFRAFLAGLTNTVQVAILGILLTGFVALGLALARLSPNRLARRMAGIWIELIRNTPLLLQLLFWHQFLIRQLPMPRQAWEPAPGVFISNRGFVFPVPEDPWTLFIMVTALLSGSFAAVMTFRLMREQGQAQRFALSALAGFTPVMVAFFAYPIAVSVPELRGFNFQGGASVSPEFIALLLALVVYQSAFMAETIRSGILAVPKGQYEAAFALGFTRWRILRLIVLPQALRIVVPPVTSQFLSLTKNSSLAVAIGYPDLVRVSQVTISETGRAVECVTIMLTVYLALSLLTAFLMDRYNRRVMRRGGAAP